MPKKSKYQIESGIPMPGAWIKEKYPFRQMKVGDSFFVARGESDKVRKGASAQNRKEDGKRFVVRAYEDDFRCWRVK